MDRKPRLLDLFCGAGGAAVGYHWAGFDVVGVDIEPQPNYPFEFHQADAVLIADDAFRGQLWFQPDVIHASPPCQAYAEVAQDRKRDDHPELIESTRELMERTGLPWVIENVPGAARQMPNAILLCGTTFGLPIVRHRLFEVEPALGLVPSACHQSRWRRAVDHPGTYPYGRKTWRPAWREHVLPTVWPWMTLDEAAQAIPPAYTEFIGLILMAQMDRAET